MKITLNREQIAKLNEVVDHFTEINNFILETVDGGIGVGISVRFSLSDNGEVVDIEGDEV
jgi:hypothetical protein